MPNSTTTENAVKERAVVATLLAEFPDNLPPHCPKLLEHAPESFDDLRHGTIALAIKELRRAGKPIAAFTVREQLNGRLEDVQFVDNLAAEAVSVALAEYAAETVWKAYRSRRLRSVYGEAAASMQAAPDEADIIAQAVRRALDDLQHDHANSPADLLRERRFKPEIEPPALRPIYSLAGQPICTPGNLTTITSAIKTGKSAVIGAMAASAMPHTWDADLLGFISSNDNGLAVLWFDSEQSPDDF